MAGSVLADPRFTKAPEPEKQAAALRDAEHYGAIEVPVVISEARRRWLLKNNCMHEATNRGTSRYYLANSPKGEPILFLLRETRNVEGANGAQMWSVHYAKSEGKVDFHKPDEMQKSGRGEGYLPVMAMRDPFSAVSAKSFRAATTGDYDLFAVFARAASCSPDHLDRRMVSHQKLEENIRAGADPGEDRHMGNMVHHSDEGGRPFVGDVDLPVFAVAPVFNPGWMKQLVLHSDVDMARKIQAELRAKIARRGVS
jgi:hypothetical protein